MANGYVSQVQLPNDETYDIKDKNAVKDITSSDIPGNINFTKGEETKDVLVKDFGTAYGIDCYKGKLPLDFTSPSGVIDEWKIYGNSSGPTEVIESQSTLPVSIDTYGGNATDWEIYGNNNPVIETESNTLPIDISSSGGNAIDYTIYGNDNNGTENWFDPTNVYIDHFYNADGSVSQTVAPPRWNCSLTPVKVLPNTEYTFEPHSTAGQTAKQLFLDDSQNVISAISSGASTFTTPSNCAYMLFSWRAESYDIMLVKGSTAPDHYIPYQKGVGERTAQLLNCATFEAGHLNSDGTIYSTSGVTSVVGGNGSVELTLSTAWRGAHCDYIDVSEFEQLYFSYSGAVNNNQWRFCFYDATQTFVSQEVMSGLTYRRLTVPNSAKYLRIGVQLSSAITYTFTNVSLIAGSTAPTTYIPYGYRIPLDIRHKTKNLIDITGYDRTLYGVRWYEDNGQLKTSGTYTDSSIHTQPRFYIELNAGTYTVSGSPNSAQAGVHLQIGTCTDEQGSNFSSLGSDTGTGYTFTLQEDSWVGIRVVTAASLYQQTVDLTLPLMLRLSDTSSDFEPYYLTNHEDIYIGNSPITQGQSITKAQSNVDLELFSGNNIIDTSLYNKPNTSITYNSSVLGVGERTENLWDLTIEQGSFDPTTGATAAGSRRVRTSESILLSANSWTVALTGADRCGVYVYDTSGNYIADESEYYWQALPYTFMLSGERKVKFVFSTNDDAQITPSMVSQPMLVKGSTAPTSYIPYGYQIPISVTSGQQSTPYNFYIGSTPLTEGQSISKTSTGTEIALYQGENTISTTLGNKPEMKIDYLSTGVGVGERTGNLYNYLDDTADCILISDGTLRIGTTGYYTSDFIAVEPGMTYTITRTGSVRAKGYDSAKQPIRTDTYNDYDIYSSKGNTFTIDNNTHYIRFTLASEFYNNCTLVSGSTAPETYIPYGYQIPINIKQDDEIVDHKDIYIGTQPLIEGDYINQTGVYRRLHQFINYASSSSLPNYNFIPITEQLIAGNGENTITTSLINNTTIDVELHPTKQASWICDKLEGLQRRIDNVDSTLGAPERRNYLVTWCSEDRLTGSTSNLDYSFNNKDNGYSTFLIDGKSTATSAFIETINLLQMINGIAQAGAYNYTVARPGKYVVVIFGVEMEDSSSNTITLKIIRDNVVIASQQLINEYVGCIPFEIPNDLYGNSTIIQIEVNSTTGWTDLSFGVGIAVLNATMLLQDGILKTDTIAIGNFSMYDSYIQLLRSHRELENKCTTLENKCTVLENEYDQLANESVKDITIYSDYTSTIPSGLNIDISQYKNKIKYVDIYFTDNNYRKGEVYPYNILAENFGYLRIPYGQIYTGASADEATRLSLSLIGDENTYYIRRELFYVLTDYEQEHLFFSQYSSVPGLILQFVGTPTNDWSDFSVKGKASEVIKIYEVHLIVSP